MSCAPGALVCVIALLLAGCQNPALTPDRLKLWGQEQQGGLIRGVVAPDTQLLLNNKQVKVSPEGYFVFGFGRDEGPALLELRFTDGRKAYRRFNPIQRNYATQAIDFADGSLVNPAAGDLERLRRDNARVGAARLLESGWPHFRERFRWPVIGPVSGVYGSVRILNGQTMQPHYGIDIAVPTGTPVAAPAGGTVLVASLDMVLTGGTIVIDHGHGLTSTFLHLSKLAVVEGQFVLPGETIGEVGATGRATGPHLDWRINWLDRRLDPALVLEANQPLP